mmetsp:Transcript_91460/g.167880  ORF Transcript_91460/g.167880 Transcript_91460/m.167880 type:complete len:2228 (-) Transcript_91460:33-6716(-)
MMTSRPLNWTHSITMFGSRQTAVLFIFLLTAAGASQAAAVDDKGSMCNASEAHENQRILLQSGPRTLAGAAVSEDDIPELHGPPGKQRNSSIGLVAIREESDDISAENLSILDKTKADLMSDAEMSETSLEEAETNTSERRMSEASSKGWFTSGELGQETCGTRPVFPQLQFELEVYRKLELVESHYAQCHEPSIRKIAVNMPFGHSITSTGDAMYQRFDRMLDKDNYHFLKDRRRLVAKVFAGVFCFLAILTIGYFAVASFPLEADNKASDALLVETSWKAGSRSWFGLDWSWLEPVISRFGWASAPQMKLGELEMNVEEDLVDYVMFRRIWQEEVKKSKRPEHTDILKAMRRFVGTPALAWLLFAASMAAILELVALTAVLDLMLNYLRIAQNARATDVIIALDPLRPTIMFICFGFGVPMLARYFSNAATLCDTYHTNRITSVLLTMIYEKSQHLPYFEDSEDQRKDVGHMVLILSNDVRRMWSGSLLSATNLLIYPACVLFLLVFLAGQLGRAAVYGFLTTFWMGFLYFPVKNNMNRGQMRWGQLANSRLELMKDAILNIRTVKATCWDIPLSECIYTLRDDELHTRYRFQAVQSLLDVPLNVFPFALVMTSLFFAYVLYGVVQTQDIFVCMQTLSGLLYCFPSIIAALQRSVSFPGVLQRIQRFLHEPEKPAGVVRKPRKEEGAPHVRVRGNFSAVEGQKPILREIDFQVQRGELVAVVGEVASGKSALLATIMGELQGSKGSTVEASKTPIFVSQEPWVVDGSVKENVILDGKENKDRFFDAMDSAGLLKDLTTIGGPKEPAKNLQQQPIDKSKIKLKQKEWKQKFKFPYFYAWNLCAIFVFAFAVYNVDWQQTRPAIGLLIAAIQGLLHWSVLEFPLQTIATLLTKGAKLAKAEADHQTICLNYNLLATSQADIDECMTNMMEGYLLNLSDQVASCLVSATNDPALMQYELQMRNDQRAQIYKQLYRDGLSWAGFIEGGEVNPAFEKKIWTKFEHLDKTDFVQNHLHKICENFAKDYMIVHRRTRVLRKCGQYQDLILLSQGHDKSFTYCNPMYYGKAARKFDDYLFHPSEDTANVKGRHFDYTLVLDSDTRVEPLSVFDMLEVAAAYPEKAIVQPAIKMDCGPEDSIFMHLDAMRQRVFEPMSVTMTTLLGKSSFFGKGLIKNAAYAKYCLGTHDRLIESVPINVLSHDTFEAAVLNPLYCNCVFLLEAPCHNYITWDIRERRWNLGEMLLAGYFWPDSFGWLTEKAQRYFQKDKFNKVHVRTVTKLDKVSSYFAHSALRQMCLKPMLLLYIVVMHFSVMKWKWTPLATVMFAIVIFPKFCTLNRNNWVDVILETGASILQFTPEGIVGTIRVLSALKAHFVGAATWIPQRAVEEESRTSNPFIFSIKFLWYYSAFALIWGMRIALYSTAVGPEALFILTILGTLFMLPVYVGFTSLQANVVQQFLGEKKKVLTVKSDEDEDAHTFGQDWEDDTTQLQVFRMNMKKMKLKQMKGGVRRTEFVKKAFDAADLEVGINGIPVSNGDRVRLGLARAAYSKRSNLVLIDDPFANVDTASGTQLLNEVIRGPMMKERTRIVTMSPDMDYLQNFDKVVLLSEGRIVVQGSPADVASTPEFQDLMDKREKDTDLEEQVVSNAVSYDTSDSILKLSCKGLDPVQEEETHGFPRWTVIADAVAAGGPIKLALAWTSVTVLRITMQAQMILLGRWADQAQEMDAGGSYYLLLTALVLVFTLCHVLQNYAIQGFSSRVSSVFFRRAFAALMRAPVEGFWNKQSAGRVLARLTDDALTIDTTLARSFLTIATIAVDVLIQQAYCFMVMPMWLMIPTYIVILIFCRFFCNTAMRLQMLSALAVTKCQEMQVQSKSSLLSVHAFHYQNQLVGKYCNQTKLVVMPDSLCSYARTWAVSRITFCLCFQCIVCVLNGIFRPEAVNVAALTMIITSTLFVVQQLNGFVGTLIESASLGVSLQRLAEYSTVQQDPPERLAGDDDKRHMMMVKDGVGLTIEGLSVRYEGAQKNALTGVSMNIMPRTKAVFAGAPGSGKSTALYSILRIVEPHAGCVLLNDVDTKRMGLLSLRSMIGLVPQEPMVFRGTVRFNIDPFGQYPEERIWAAIQCAQLMPTVRRFDRGLDYVFSDEGSNLSVGQKQLVSLARVVCKQPSLVLMDECASSVDPRTREAVHDTMTLNFPNSTVIAATRRLDEIRHFQHAVIFDKGQVVHEGPVGSL